MIAGSCPCFLQLSEPCAGGCAPASLRPPGSRWTACERQLLEGSVSIECSVFTVPCGASHDALKQLKEASI
eukprot:6967987-Lingulodinium_polyedra.AAC.1